VEGGKIQYPWKKYIAGNLKDMFRNIVAVGNDVVVRGSRQCGSILVGQMTVAGSKPYGNLPAATMRLNRMLGESQVTRSSNSPPVAPIFRIVSGLIISCPISILSLVRATTPVGGLPDNHRQRLPVVITEIA